MFARYLWRVLVGFDQLCNAILFGDPSETISYRSAAEASRGNRFACVLCRFLDLFQRDHCAKTVEATDKERLLFCDALSRGEQPL